MNNWNAGLGVPLRTELLSRLGCNHEDVRVGDGLVDQIDQLLIRLCTVLGTGRGIVDQPFDRFVCRVVGRTVWCEEERDGSSRSLLLKEWGQTESNLGVRSPCAPSSGSQASDSRLPLDNLVRRNLSLHERIYAFYLRTLIRFLST